MQSSGNQQAAGARLCAEAALKGSSAESVEAQTRRCRQPEETAAASNRVADCGTCREAEAAMNGIDDLVSAVQEAAITGQQPERPLSCHVTHHFSPKLQGDERDTGKAAGSVTPASAAESAATAPKQELVPVLRLAAAKEGDYGVLMVGHPPMWSTIGQGSWVNVQRTV
jgi:hypothetical protein